MEIGCTIDPSIYQHAFATWANDAMDMADVVRGMSSTSGHVQYRARMLAELTVRYLKKHYELIDWFVIEDQVFRKQSRARAIAVLHTATIILVEEIRRTWPHARIILRIPEHWKQPGTSKLSTEIQCRRFLSALEIAQIVDGRFRLDWRQRKKYGKAFVKMAGDQWDAVAIGMSHIGRGMRATGGTEV
jgi:hypothetical protein